MQDLADDHSFSWGAQYELARGVCSGQWTWEGILAHEDELKKSCTGKPNEGSAPYVAGIMGRPGMANNDCALWCVSNFPTVVRSFLIRSAGLSWIANKVL